MIIIGCDYHPGFGSGLFSKQPTTRVSNKLHLWIRIQGRYKSGDWSTERKRKG